MAGLRGAAAKELLRKALKAARLARVPAWRAGLRHGVAASIEHDRLPLRRDFSTVIDVGANRGQFALYASVRFPEAHVYSLEPLSKPRRKMESLFAESLRVHVIPRAAGAEPGEATINVSKQDDSSSLLGMAALQLERYPDTAMAGTEKVEVARLDALLHADMLARPVLLKLDVQGYELEALKGAGALLEHVDAVLTEASFVPFYEGQPLFDDLHGWLTGAGFSLVAGAISAQHAGRWEQGDFLYERSRGTDALARGSEAAAA